MIRVPTKDVTMTSRATTAASVDESEKKISTKRIILYLVIYGATQSLGTRLLCSGPLWNPVHSGMGGRSRMDRWAVAELQGRSGMAYIQYMHSGHMYERGISTITIGTLPIEFDLFWILPFRSFASVQHLPDLCVCGWRGRLRIKGIL